MKINITRDIDRQYGYDLEIETSVSRDGICCHGYINGDCVVVKFGPMAETDVRVHLFRAVTWELNNGARENLTAPVVEETIMSYPDAKFNRQTAQNWDRVIEEDMQEEVMTSQPTYAELVAAREAAYIAQRDTENKLNEIKAALTATIAADPAYKNDQQRKAELVNRLQDYDTYVDQAQRAADQYRATLAALEVYQEQAKDARAKMRYETAQLELRAAELQLQAAQARHDAQEPTDEDPWGSVNVAGIPKRYGKTQRRENWDFDAFNRVDGELPHQKPDAIKHKSIVPNFETQHSWVLDVWNALSTIPSGDSAGYVTKCVHDGRVRNELIINSDGQVVVFENEGDCQDYTFAMRDLYGFGEWSVREVWYERPF